MIQPVPYISKEPGIISLQEYDKLCRQHENSSVSTAVDEDAVNPSPTAIQRCHIAAFLIYSSVGDDIAHAVAVESYLVGALRGQQNLVENLNSSRVL